MASGALRTALFLFLACEACLAQVNTANAVGNANSKLVPQPAMLLQVEEGVTPGAVLEKTESISSVVQSIPENAGSISNGASLLEPISSAKESSSGGGGAIGSFDEVVGSGSNAIDTGSQSVLPMVGSIFGQQDTISSSIGSSGYYASNILPSVSQQAFSSASVMTMSDSFPSLLETSSKTQEALQPAAPIGHRHGVRGVSDSSASLSSSSGEGAGAAGNPYGAGLSSADGTSGSSLASITAIQSSSSAGQAADNANGGNGGAEGAEGTEGETGGGGGRPGGSSSSSGGGGGGGGGGPGMMIIIILLLIGLLAELYIKNMHKYDGPEYEKYFAEHMKEQIAQFEEYLADKKNKERREALADALNPEKGDDMKHNDPEHESEELLKLPLDFVLLFENAEKKSAEGEKKAHKDDKAHHKKTGDDQGNDTEDKDSEDAAFDSNQGKKDDEDEPHPKKAGAAEPKADADPGEAMGKLLGGVYMIYKSVPPIISKQFAFYLLLILIAVMLSAAVAGAAN